MKLKNLLFATMIAGAFTACSSDDENIPTPPVDGGTTLSIRTDNVQTKADDALSKLTVVVVKTDGNIEVAQEVTPLNGESGDITITGGEKKVIVLANVTLPASVNTMALLQTYTQTFDNEAVAAGSEALSMNSKVYTISIVPGNKHYLGYTAARAAEKAGTNPYKEFEIGAAVKLYRNVAKISVGTIKVGQKLTPDDPANTQYPNPKFEMTGIYLVQGAGTTQIVGENVNEWGKTFVANSYATWDATAYAAYAEGTISAGPFASPIISASYAKTFSPAKLIASVKNEVGPNTENTYAGGEIFYTYENLNKLATEGLTVLALKGTFSFGPEDNRTVMENRYYSFAVGVTGFETLGYSLPTSPDFAALVAAPNASGRSFSPLAAGKAIGVLRNLEYKISEITLNGPGYPSPFGPPPGGEKATLDVKVVVVGWGQVEQSPVIE